MPPRKQPAPVRVQPVSIPEHRNPVTIYLRSLSLSSIPSRTSMLEGIARAWTGGECTAKTFPWWRLTRDDLLSLRNWAVEAHSLRYAQMHLHVVRRVLRECVRLKLLSADACQDIIDIPPIVGEGLLAGRHVSPEEFQKLFSYLTKQSSATATRDLAAFGIMHSTGVRRTEARTARMEDYDEREGSLVVHGKRNKWRKVYLPGWAVRLVGRWLAHRGRRPGPLLCKTHESGTVYPSQFVNSDTFYEQLTLRIKQAGVKHFSPHDMRRTFIGDRLEEGHDIVKVQRSVGHSSPKQTAHYDRRPEKARQAMSLSVPNPLA